MSDTGPFPAARDPPPRPPPGLPPLGPLRPRLLLHSTTVRLTSVSRWDRRDVTESKGVVNPTEDGRLEGNPRETPSRTRPYTPGPHRVRQVGVASGDTRGGVRGNIDHTSTYRSKRITGHTFLHWTQWTPGSDHSRTSGEVETEGTVPLEPSVHRVIHVDVVSEPGRAGWGAVPHSFLCATRHITQVDDSTPPKSRIGRRRQTTGTDGKYAPGHKYPADNIQSVPHVDTRTVLHWDDGT